MTSFEVITKDIPVYIYALCEPEEPWNVRYIGKTRRDLGRRLYEHVWIAKKFRARDHKERWVKGLISSGLTPIIKLLDIGNELSWQSLEMFYIASYKEVGFTLVNTTVGGEITPSWLGKKHSKETKLKISRGNKGKKRTEEQRFAQSVRNRLNPTRGMLGKSHSEELKSKTAVLKKGNKNCVGRVMSQETRDKIATKAKGNKRWLGKSHSDETKRKISETQKFRRAKKSELKIEFISEDVWERMSEE